MSLSALSRVTQLFLLSLLLTLFGFIFVGSTAAQSPQTFQMESAAYADSSSQHVRVQTLIFDMFSAGACILTGIDPLHANGCVSYNRETQTFGYAADSQDPNIKGLLGFTTNSMGQMFVIPVSTQSYIAYVADNFGITPQARAQTQGFDQLNGTLEVWKIFRNIAYLLFVLIFAIIGLGVMLRLKIDPRTVMSIQNQIPRLIVGLILITFSYAIAGLMVDLMWTTTYMTIGIADQVKVTDKSATNAVPQPTMETKKITESLLSSPLGFANTLFGYYREPSNSSSTNSPDGQPTLGIVGFAGSISGTIGKLVGEMLTPLESERADVCSLDFRPSAWFRESSPEGCARGFLNIIIVVIADIIIFFIVAIALLVAFFRIWWQLLKSFAYIIIYTAIAPVYIAGGLLPGSTVGFNSWIRGLAANLAVYPSTVAFLLGANIFFRTFDAKDVNGFAPPLTGNPLAAGGFGYIAAFSIIMITPELIHMLRDALKAPPNKYIAPAIQAGFGRGAILPGAIARGAWHKAYKFDPYGKGLGVVNQGLHGVRDYINTPGRSRWINNPIGRGFGRIVGSLGGH